MPEPVVVAVTAPLALALAASLLGGRRGRWPGLLAAAAVVAAVALLTRDVVAHGPVRHQVGGWGAPLGIDLFVDGLALLFLWLSAGVGAAATVYATAYFHDDEAAGAFWPAWLTLWGGLQAVFVTADLFNAYVGLELLGLAAVALVALGGGRAIGAATRYLLVSMLGSLLYLLGVALLYAAHGTLDLSRLAAAAGEGGLERAALAAMLAGLLFKTAIVPLHAWLPPAHADAPGPASAVLSALVVKATLYLALRLWTELPGLATAGWLVGALGAAAVLWGGLHALRAPRLKLLVAYSTVGQLGYVLLAFPLLPSSAAVAGAAYQALAHGVAKAALFLAASTVLRAAGGDHVDDLRGLGHRLPVTAVAFGLAGASIVGLPPSGGFVAKWLLLTAAVRAGAWWVVLVIALGGLLAAAYVLRVVGRSLAPPPAGAPPLKAPRRLEWTALLLALASVALGLVAAWPLALLEGPAP